MIRNRKKERGLNPHVCSWSSLCLIFMQNLYESIKNEPFKIPEDDGNDLTHTFFNPDREGWLLKLGKSASGVQILKCASPPPLKSNLIQAVLLFQFRTTFFVLFCFLELQKYNVIYVARQNKSRPKQAHFVTLVVRTVQRTTHCWEQGGTGLSTAAGVSLRTSICLSHFSHFLFFSSLILSATFTPVKLNPELLPPSQ